MVRYPHFLKICWRFAAGFGVWWRSVNIKVHRLKSLPIFPVDIKFQSYEWSKKGCWSSAVFFRWSYVLLSLVEAHAYWSTFLLYVCLMMMKELVWCSVGRWTMAIQWNDYEQMIEPIVLSKRGAHWVVLIDGVMRQRLKAMSTNSGNIEKKISISKWSAYYFQLRLKQLSAQRFGHTRERSTRC